MSSKLEKWKQLDAERQVAVGKLKLVYPASACSVVSDHSRRSDYATWESVSGLGAGAYGLIFYNGAVAGHAVHLVTIELSCDSDTHLIGVETMSHSASNGVSLTPDAEFASSVGRADGYLQRAAVLVKATTENVAVFAYASDGRALKKRKLSESPSPKWKSTEGMAEELRVR